MSNPTHYMAFYTETKSSKDENDVEVVDMQLKNKYIPEHLKDLYIENFSHLGSSVSGQDIDNFLKSHITQ